MHKHAKSKEWEMGHNRQIRKPLGHLYPSVCPVFSLVSAGTVFTL